MKRILPYCICIMASLVVDSAVAYDIEPHRSLLVQKFDTSRWKAYWSDDTWYIRCLFTDVNGDGMEDLIACSTSEEEDPVGYVWLFWVNDTKDGLTSVRMLREGISWLCHSDSFFKMVSDNGKQKVIGLGMHAGRIEGELGKIVKPTPDCEFRVVGNSYRLCELTPDVDSAFMRNDYRFIERLYPEWYFGFDFKPPKDIPHNPYRERPPYVNPKGDFRVGGGIQEPPKFAEFAERYRQTKIQKFGADNNSDAVYAVFLDADNDGDTDFYVTTDLDKLDGDDYSWELYVQHGGEFVKAMDVVYPVTSRKELCGLPPTVKSSQTSFCRVVRLDVEPFFLIVDKEKKNQVRDAIMNSFAHRVEKLACRAYFRDRSQACWSNPL